MKKIICAIQSNKLKFITVVCLHPTITQNVHFFYFQLDRLVFLQEFTKEITEKLKKKNTIPQISDENWKVFANLVEVLKRVNDATVKMQREKYAPSDLYGDWIKLKMQLASFEAMPIANNIIEQMKKREDGLINTPTVFASVFVDPRYRLLMSQDESSTALRHLSEVRERLKRLKEANVERPESTTIFEHTDEVCELTALLRAKKASNIYYSHPIPDIDFFRQILNMPLTENLNVSPIEFWADWKNIDRELLDIVSIVNAAAPTQASVERVFSALSFILSSRRTRLGDNLLDNILIIRLNKQLLIEQVKLSF